MKQTPPFLALALFAGCTEPSVNAPAETDTETEAGSTTDPTATG